MKPRSLSLPRAFTGRLDRPTGQPEEWFLGSLQTKVIAALGRRGPSSVRDIVGALPKRDALAYTTVMTVLGRLHDKGLVTRKKIGKGYLYESRFTSEELHDRMAKHLVGELVDDFGDVVLAHFASALDGVDRRRLEKIRKGGR